MLTVSKLNKEIFTKDIKCVSLGKLSSEVTERHKNDFMSDVEYFQGE